MDETTKPESAMQIANQLIAETPTENVSTNENIKEKKMAETTTRNIFNSTPATGLGDGFLGGAGGMGGGIGGFLIGALLGGRGGLFGGNGVGETNAITQQMLSQDLGDIKADVATSALETQKAVAASNMDVNATLFNQSGLIQGQMAAQALNAANSAAHTNQYIAAGLANVKDAADAGFASNKDAIYNSAIANMKGFADINALAAVNNAQIQKSAADNALITERGVYQTAQTVRDDGEKHVH